MARHHREWCPSHLSPTSTNLLLNLVIIPKTGAVDDVYKAISSTDDAEKQAEGKKIIEQLGNLKYEMLHDRKLTYAPLPKPCPKR